MKRSSGWLAIGKIGKRMLARLDPVVGRVVAAQRAEVPAFAALSLAAHRSLTELNLRWAIQSVLVEQRQPTAQELTSLEAGVEVRTRAGVPLEAMLQAFHIGIRESWIVALDAAEKAGTPRRTLIDLIRARDRFANTITTHIVASHRRMEREAGQLEERRRSRFLYDLLTGKGRGGHEAWRRAPSYGLSPEEPHLILRARPGSDASARELERSLVDLVARHGEGGLLGQMEGDLVGVLPASLSPSRVEATVGVALARSLMQLDDSFEHATRALETALAFGLVGMHSLEDLGAKGAVASEVRLSTTLHKRYVEPLRGAGAFGATLLETLGAFFRNGLRTELTARELGIHVNSFRHRLARCAELIGADLDRVDDLVGIWWAMEWEKVRAARETRHERQPSDVSD
jgi:hypothetical protein